MLTETHAHCPNAKLSSLTHSSAEDTIFLADVPENKRSYSSVYNNEKPGTGHARSTLNSPQGWSAQHNKVGQWIQFDLGTERLVAGTVIQPRNGNSQYVTQYTVSTSLDNKNWAVVPGDYGGHSSQIRENRFSQNALVRARYVRMTVKKWGNHIALRAGVLIAENKGILTSYIDLNLNVILHTLTLFI